MSPTTPARWSRGWSGRATCLFPSRFPVAALPILFVQLAGLPLVVSRFVRRTHTGRSLIRVRGGNSDSLGHSAVPDRDRRNTKDGVLRRRRKETAVLPPYSNNCHLLSPFVSFSFSLRLLFFWESYETDRVEWFYCCFFALLVLPGRNARNNCTRWCRFGEMLFGMVVS